jgi:peptidoglycan/LPS O-acetylase OafA/YrhL
MRRLALLDYGRFAAAAAVVFYHYFFNGIANGKVTSLAHMPAVAGIAQYGYLGVELFFMISGYVIFFSARAKGAGEFLVSRAVRLYPAFWCAVLLTSALALFWGGEAMAVSLPQVLANLTMAPKLFGYGPVDGVYWTLIFEWRFYLAVALILVLGLQRRLEDILLAWPVAIAAAWLAGLEWLPFAHGYYAYFAAGAIFAVHAARPGWKPALMLALCLALCLRFSTSEAGYLAFAKDSAVSLPVIACIVLALFAFFAVLNTRRGSELRLPGSRLAGALTYPVYLIHAHIGYMLLSRFATEENQWLAYPALIAAVLAAAWLMHRLVERRLAGAWRRLFERLLGLPVAALQDKLEVRRRGLV